MAVLDEEGKSSEAQQKREAGGSEEESEQDQQCEMGQNVESEEGEPRRAKRRWTVAGYMDPDLERLAREGQPKMCQLRYSCCRDWVLEFSDVGTAFLNSPPIRRREGALYVRMTKGDAAPGENDDDIYELLAPVFGLNTAPVAWFRTSRDEFLAGG